MNKQISAFVLISIFWVGLFGFTKVFTSGYHWIDEHEDYGILTSIEKTGLSNAMFEHISGDLHQRFRPLYYVQKSLQVYFFQDKFIFYYIFNTISIILTCFFLFLFAFKSKIDWIASLFFPFLIVLGTQIEIWCRISPSESPALLYLSISLLFCLNASMKIDKSFKNEVGMICFLLISTLFKESFILLVPAYALFYIGLINKFNSIHYLDIIKKKKNIIFILLSIFIVEILIILFFVGTAENGYAGVDGFKQSYISNLSKSISSLFYKYSNQTGFIILCLLLGLILEFYRKEKTLTQNFKIILKEIGPVIVIAIAILAPQFLLYMKSKMDTRYLIPATIGTSFLLIYFYDKLVTLTKSFMVKYLIGCLLALILYNRLIVSYHEFKIFTEDGYRINKFLTEIKKQTTSKSDILFAFDPAIACEWGQSMNEYFDSPLNNRLNKKFLILLDKPINQYSIDSQNRINSEYKAFKNALFENNKSLDYKIIALPKELENRLVNYDINVNNYTRLVIEQEWLIFYKK